MNKEEFLKRLDELNLDKNRYCIISGGAMLLYGLKETTNDLDIQVSKDYFDELNERLDLKLSTRYDYVYELNDYTDIVLREIDYNYVEYVDGYPVESLEKELEWRIQSGRDKDKEVIDKIQAYLNKKKED